MALEGLSKAMDPRAAMRLKKAEDEVVACFFSPFIQLSDRDSREFASLEIYDSTKIPVGVCKWRVVRFEEDLIVRLKA